MKVIMKVINKKYCCWFCGKLLKYTGEKYLGRPASFILRCNNHDKYFVDFCGFENRYIDGLIENLNCIKIFEKEIFKDYDWSLPVCYFLNVDRFSIAYAFISGDEIELLSFPLNEQPEIIAAKIANKINMLITFS